MVNKKIRNMIKNDYDILNGLTGNSDFSKIILMNNIIDQRKSECKEDYVRYYTTLSVLFSDLYKSLNLKKRLNILNVEDTIIFQILNGYEDLNTFLDDCLNDPKLLCRLVDSTLEFNELSILGKMNLMKSLNDNDILYLKKLCPTFSYDIKDYDKILTYEQYCKFFKNINMHHKNNYIDSIDTIKLITDYINNLGIIRKEEFNETVKNYYKFYDKFCYYLDSKGLLSEDEKKTFDIIHGFSDENIELYIKNNNRILDILVGFNLFINCAKKGDKYYVESISFSEEDVDLLYNGTVKTKEK